MVLGPAVAFVANGNVQFAVDENPSEVEAEIPAWLRMNHFKASAFSPVDFRMFNNLAAAFVIFNVLLSDIDEPFRKIDDADLGE